jgi:hypothetical protein
MVCLEACFPLDVVEKSAIPLAPDVDPLRFDITAADMYHFRERERTRGGEGRREGRAGLFG